MARKIKYLLLENRKSQKIKMFTNPKSAPPDSSGTAGHIARKRDSSAQSGKYGHVSYGQVIQHQPSAHQTSSQVVAADGWMPIPQAIPRNCPDGLQYLSTIDELLIKQQVGIIEALIGFETNNKYVIKNNAGEKVFYAVEDNDCCTRNCWGSMRPFEMKILDSYKNEVIHLSRPLACQICLFPCCLQRIEVFSPPGCLIGIVEQDWSILKPIFTIRNAANEEVFKMKGPICEYSCCGEDIEYKILSKDKTAVVGRISKKWSGLLREVFTDADFFGINFPMDLDVRMKAVLLGACFLIDLMFFEK
ncbi:phospholipid scramblase 2-like [Myzus persicae]|uniref:phospholipid scramblase 2-like n=1 Tax=Myzus persicae TaxID=13164 RepID=UPI000B93979B|nr:phospholipid scramblase 2-like [Myzus persicae]